MQLESYGLLFFSIIFKIQEAWHGPTVYGKSCRAAIENQYEFAVFLLSHLKTVQAFSSHEAWQI